MKITRRQLKQIIKEELARVLNESPRLGDYLATGRFNAVTGEYEDWDPITTDSPQQDPRHLSQQIHRFASGDPITTDTPADPTFNRRVRSLVGTEEPDTSYETGAAPPRTVRRASMMEPEERAAIAAVRGKPEPEQPPVFRGPGTGAGHMEPEERAAIADVRLQMPKDLGQTWPH